LTQEVQEVFWSGLAPGIANLSWGDRNYGVEHPRMSEPVFFPPAARISLADIVACTGAAVIESADLSAIISGAAPLDEAGPGELTFLDSPENVVLLETSRATACFVTPDDASRLPKATLALVMEEPYRGFALALQRMFPQATQPKSLLGTAGINPGASIHSEARLEQGVIIDPGVIIGPRAEIGFGSIIGANSVIGSDVRIGRDCLIGPQVTISHALIGNRVIVHPGAHIGQSAIDFRHAGIALAQPGLPKAPGIGRVIIQDGVEVGANSTIDRGTAGDTVIGEETRIGNLARIAENVVIGRHCIIPAQAGLSARARLHDFASLGA
jgi:UDP-3-O-[3-hydroxymyristoyl] glucosamine N-acyltransferase